MPGVCTMLPALCLVLFVGCGSPETYFRANLVEIGLLPIFTLAKDLLQAVSRDIDSVQQPNDLGHRIAVDVALAGVAPVGQQDEQVRGRDRSVVVQIGRTD